MQIAVPQWEPRRAAWCRTAPQRSAPQRGAMSANNVWDAELII